MWEWAGVANDGERWRRVERCEKMRKGCETLGGVGRGREGWRE